MAPTQKFFRPAGRKTSFEAREHSLRADAALEHQPGAGAQFLGLALQLTASGKDVASARRANGRGIAGVEHDLGEGLDAVPIRAFIARARPRIEGDEIDLGRNAAQQANQFARVSVAVIYVL